MKILFFFWIEILYLLYKFYKILLLIYADHYDKTRAIMSPYNPRASAKIRIKIIPTKILSH
jgi:hypothetical protein